VHVTGNEPVAGASVDSDATMRANVAWHVHRVGADGVAAIDLSLSKVNVHVDGRSVDAPEQSAVSLKIAPDGRVLTAAGLDGSLGAPGSKPVGLSPSAGQQIAPVLPDGDVSIGDTWTRSFTQELPDDLGSVKVNSTSRYVRDQVLNGVDTVVVQTDYDVPVDLSFSQQGVTVSSKGTIRDAVTSWVDLGSRRLQQVVSNMTADISVDAGNGSGSATISMHETALTTLRRI
jgi:hypothetical protein